MAENTPSGKESPKAPNLVRMVIIGALLAVTLIWGGTTLYHSFLYVETDNAQIVGDIYPVISRVPGKVEAVPASDNEEVKQGDTLITLDPSDYRIKRDMAEAALQNARASVSAAGATASAAAATERKLSADLRRNRSLRQLDVISPAEFDAISSFNGLDLSITCSMITGMNINWFSSFNSSVLNGIISPSFVTLVRMRYILAHASII